MESLREFVKRLGDMQDAEDAVFLATAPYESAVRSVQEDDEILPGSYALVERGKIVVVKIDEDRKIDVIVPRIIKDDSKDDTDVSADDDADSEEV